MYITVAAGNLVADPTTREIKNPRTGEMDKVTNFRVACRNQFAPNSENKKTMFLDCNCWRKLAEIAGKYLYKGRYVSMTGYVEARHSTGMNGKVYDHIVFNVQQLELVGQNEENAHKAQNTDAVVTPAPEAQPVEIPVEGTVADEGFAFDASQMPF